MPLKPVLVSSALALICALAIDGVLILGREVSDAMAAETVPAQPWADEHDNAVKLARTGDTAAALLVLERLHHDHPDDIGVARDLVVVTAWAGHDAVAAQLFVALPPGPQPDYVIEAVAPAYLHLKQPAEALALYRRGLDQSPDKAQFMAGEIRAMVDLGEIESAIGLAQSDLLDHGERVEVLLAAGYAATTQKKPVEALRYIDRAAKIDPANSEVTHDRIMAIDQMGGPQIARQLADANPGAVSDDESRQIDSDAAAALVRWGPLEPPSEERRFAASDRAIAVLDVLIARWTRDGEPARGAVLRSRFDRMVALRDRVRMADVVAEYEDLLREGATVPAYALEAAGDAYLYLHQPEKARDLYLRCLVVDPKNPETRLALFYAYADLDDIDAAYRQVDHAASDQAIWIYLKGLNEPIENPERATADLAAAEARLNAGELAEANVRIAKMAQAAPNNTRYITALADAYAARGWPRLAAEEYEISRALKPKDASTEVAQALNLLELRDYRDVEAAVADLKRRFPENLEVQRLDRLWQVHNMAEFRLDVEQDLRSATDLQGGDGIAIETQLYSPPIDYNWRVFGDEYVAHEILPQGEGAITLRQSGLGAEYSDRGLLASLEGTISAFGPRTGDTLTASPDQGHGGARAQATWSIDDYWQISGDTQIFSRDTPLRALGHGITANSAASTVAYRESELREVEVSGEAMDFSDGNTRTSLDGKFTQRLVTQPHFSIDGIAGLAESHNSANANRLYYNPRQDLLGTMAVSINQELYRRYEFVYDHHLVVTPGVYWEQGFGSGGAGSILYEHRVKADDVFEAGLGVSFSRQPYDGAYDNAIALLLNVRLRF